MPIRTFLLYRGSLSHPHGTLSKGGIGDDHDLIANGDPGIDDPDTLWGPRLAVHDQPFAGDELVAGGVTSQHVAELNKTATGSFAMY